MNANYFIHGTLIFKIGFLFLSLANFFYLLFFYERKKSFVFFSLLLVNRFRLFNKVQSICSKLFDFSALRLPDVFARYLFLPAFVERVIELFTLFACVPVNNLQ